MTLPYDRTLANGTIVAVPTSPRIRFRHNIAVAVAGFGGVIAAIPLAGARAYLLPILLIPAAIMVWGWRAGVDADTEGLTVRAMLAARRLPWSEITGFAVEGRRVTALLTEDRAVRLPVVSPSDVPAMLKAGDQDLSTLNLDEPEPPA